MLLRHTGVRIEELTELSHHSLIHYTLPATGELVPLLQIAPSKPTSSGYWRSAPNSPTCWWQSSAESVTKTVPSRS